MPAHYGVTIIPAAHKNAINVAIALWIGDDPAVAENIGQPLNTSGSPADPVTHWVGGRPYNGADLVVIQDFVHSLPIVSWPVTGVTGAVTQQQATDAATALYIMAGTADVYTSPLAAQTLASALGSMGLKRVILDD